MSVNLPVPYKSQWDGDANGTYNDCGPASIAMNLNFYGEKLSTDDVYKKTGAGKDLISISQMMTAISAFGYKAERRIRQTVAQLKAVLDSGKPVIALVHYGSLKSTQDKNFKGGHFFLVVGYREDGYFVNDPNFRGDLRSHGDHHFYTKEEFEKSWADASLDGNQPNSFIVIERKSQPVTAPQSPASKDLEKLSNFMEKSKIQSVDELIQKIVESSGFSWGDENEQTDPERGGGHLGAARRENRVLKAELEDAEKKLTTEQSNSEIERNRANLWQGKAEQLQRTLDNLVPEKKDEPSPVVTTPIETPVQKEPVNEEVLADFIAGNYMLRLIKIDHKS